MKRVITHGCSFTKYKWDTWPKFLPWFEKDIHIQNYGHSASGNETIARGVVNSVLKYKGIHHMYIMWSGSDRYEIIRDTAETLEHHKYGSTFGLKKDDFPNSAFISERTVSIPFSAINFSYFFMSSFIS